MKYRFKLVLLVLLLTLPLRGFAAVAAHGAPTLHHDGISVAYHPDMVAAAAHQYNVDSSSHGLPHTNPADKPATICGESGACCTGTISDTYGSVAPIGVIPSSLVITFLARPYAGFIPEGPERPPRSFLC